MGAIVGATVARPAEAETPLVVAAAAFARERHAGQSRKGTALPYIVHPEGVAAILGRCYPGRDDLQAAGWLHDTLEDTATTRDELESRFGPRILDLVDAVTLGWRQLFHPRGDLDALRLKAADTLDNVAFTIAGIRGGEEVWDRFHAGRGKVAQWRRVAREADRRIGSEALAAQLDAAVREVAALAGMDHRPG